MSAEGAQRIGVLIVEDHQVLAEGLPAGEPRTYAAQSKWGEVPYSTLYHRAHGRRSKEDKVKSQQYLNPSEEKALVKYLLRMSNNDFPVPIKCLYSFRVDLLEHASYQPNHIATLLIPQNRFALRSTFADAEGGSGSFWLSAYAMF